jgi:hypothetical protein
MAEVKDDTKEEVWLVLTGTAKSNNPTYVAALEDAILKLGEKHLTNPSVDISSLKPHNPTPEVIEMVKAMFAPVVPFIENGKERRQQRFEKEYIVAEQVAAIPDLTASERCHAVIYGLKKLNDRERTEQRNETLSQQSSGAIVYDARVKFNTAGEYGHFHDTMKFDDIEKGIHKSASALFD